MTAAPARFRRALLVKGLPPAAAADKLAAYSGLSGGRKSPHDFALSSPHGDWLAIGVPASLPAYHFHNLLIWLTGLPEDTVRAAAVVAADAAGTPADYTLVPEAGNEWGDSAAGRRADGAALRADIPAGTLTATPDASAGPAPLAAQLTNLGVSAPLLPRPGGFVIEGDTTVRVEIAVQ